MMTRTCRCATQAMRAMIASALAALLHLAAKPPTLAAQGYVVGMVRDTAGRALVDAQVLLESTTLSARTDSTGRGQ